MLFNVESCRFESEILPSDFIPSSSIPMIQSQLSIPSLNKYNLLCCPDTKAGAGEFLPNSFDLDSVLDYAKQETLNTGDALYREIPFIQNNESGYVLFHDSVNYEEKFTPYPGEIKRYYISASGKHINQTYFVTMLTDPVFLESDGREYSFLYKRNYSGLILVSDINGNLTGFGKYDWVWSV